MQDFAKVSIRGHIIDSLILAKVLDLIVASGATYEIESLEVGKGPEDTSYSVIRIETREGADLRRLLDDLHPHGVTLVDEPDAQVVEAEADGVLPSGFYLTVGEPTQVRLNGTWTKSLATPRFCALVVDSDRVLVVALAAVRAGQGVVVGTDGVRVAVHRRGLGETQRHRGLGAPWRDSTENSINAVAEKLRLQRKTSEKTVLVIDSFEMSPRESNALAQLVRGGWIDVVICTNSFALQDLTAAALGQTEVSDPYQADNIGDQLRVLNATRAAGSVSNAISTGLVTQGVIHACCTRGIDFVIVGSVADVDVIAETITDTVAARKAIHDRLSEATFVIALASGALVDAIYSESPSTTETISVGPQPTRLTDRQHITMNPGLFAILLTEVL